MVRPVEAQHQTSAQDTGLHLTHPKVDQSLKIHRLLVVEAANLAVERLQINRLLLSVTQRETNSLVTPISFATLTFPRPSTILIRRYVKIAPSMFLFHCPCSRCFHNNARLCLGFTHRIIFPIALQSHRLLLSQPFTPDLDQLPSLLHLLHYTYSQDPLSSASLSLVRMVFSISMQVMSHPLLHRLHPMVAATSSRILKGPFSFFSALLSPPPKIPSHQIPSISLHHVHPYQCAILQEHLCTGY